MLWTHEAQHDTSTHVVCNSCRQRQIGQSYCDIIANGGKTRHRQLTTLVSVSWGGGGTIAHESKRKGKDKKKMEQI